jgi:hypothetical protein
MDIDRFKHQHVDILARIDALRRLAHQGVENNSAAIADHVAKLGSVVKLHLAIEDRILYPSVRRAADPGIAQLAEAYQEEMKGIAFEYQRFTKKWSSAAYVANEPEAFRVAANTALREVYLRMQRENQEFYPAIEAL